MSKFGVLVGTAIFALIGTDVPAVFAGTAITMQTDQTQLIALSTEPGTVVVGNPSIADVSVKGKQVFMHGRAFGETNILILDLSGNQIANFDVSVTHDNPNGVVILSAALTKPQVVVIGHYICTENCYREMIPGDTEFGSIVGQNGGKASFASGSRSTDAAPTGAPGGAPPAAQ